MVKKIVACLLAGVFLSLTGCYAQAKVAAQKASLTEDEPDNLEFTWDFQRVKEGEVLRHKFIFKNKTTRELNITDVNTSCGCTVSQVKDKTLAAGESTSLEVSFNSKGYHGQVKHFVYLHTDSPDEPLVKFTIKAWVEKASAAAAGED